MMMMMGTYKEGYHTKVEEWSTKRPRDATRRSMTDVGPLLPSDKQKKIKKLKIDDWTMQKFLEGFHANRGL